MIDLVFFGLAAQPLYDGIRETAILLLDVVRRAGLGLRPHVFLLWQRILKGAVLINVLRAAPGQTAA
jgi:hypothetical protein